MSRQESSASENVAALRPKAGAEPIASFLNMRLVELSEGYARVSMKLKPESAERSACLFLHHSL